ncbi:Reductases with broad range of substrate specificities [Phaffia rhodozyma]|uniref:Reductases with broad range of substrate specificities n=1 Tax=Phaffia rhodozyma TaxID=264483 RepID=A0A0F7SHY6_PHARH|nr:Reductases with broad range of substrate specificities [Phaffia rhodozyma]
MSTDPRVIIVTGASSGIGRATSIALSKAGFQVVLVGRRQEELEVTKESCPEKSVIVAADVSSEEGVKLVFKKSVEAFGRVDAIFNNAGCDSSKHIIEDLPLSEFDKVFALNVRGAFMMTQEAVRQMKAQSPQGGRIINNGSISAYAPRPDSAPYTMSKHAILGLTKCTQLDGRPFNIACSQIDIGNAVTSLGNTNAPKIQASGHQLVEPAFPVDQVANAVVYMASLPLGTNVANMTIMATNMPFIGRG